MRIHESKPDIVRSDTTGRIRDQNAGISSDEKLRPVAPVGRADRVEISDEARALAEQAGAGATGVTEPVIEADGPPTPGLTPEQVDALRARVADGYYDRPEILDQVATRLFDSGDL